MFGLSPEAIDMIIKILSSYPDISEAKIFGSRAMGNYRENSDIDIALWGKIDEKILARISGDLAELPLPYQFDVTAYNQISHPPFKTHIDQYGKNLFSKVKT